MFPTTARFTPYGDDRAYDRCSHGTARHAGSCRFCDEESSPAEDLTPEGIQLVIPGAERRALPTTKQGELF